MKRNISLLVAMMAIVNMLAQDVTYLDADGKSQTLSSGRYESIGSQNELTNGWYVLDNSVTINSRVTVSGTVRLVLKDGCTLTLPKGIQLKEGNSLTIYGQAGGTGKLTAGPCESYLAGIGGNAHERAGTLTVNGGNVEAKAGFSAAGIGGGAQGFWAGDYGHGGIVEINGGTIYAKGDQYGAGIGGGGNDRYSNIAIPGEGGSVTINGGKVTAIGGDSGGYGIGPGRSSGNEGTPGTLSLGWRNKTDRIYMSSVNAEITMNSEFVYEDTEEAVTADDLGGRAIIPSDTSAPITFKVKGDVNDDKKVDISDVVAAINHIAGKSTYPRADVNVDLSVDISDIVAVINIIASGVLEPEDDTDPAVKAGLCPDENHPHVIDMGAAGKWSCCNVGASAPWKDGGYYAWGETEEKDYYGVSTYSHCDGSSETMHNIGSDISFTDYDVAHVKWGSEWHMPSIDDWILFCDKCSGKPSMLNGVSGMLYTGPGGARIFMPAAGFYVDESIFLKGKVVYCWSSNPSTKADMSDLAVSFKYDYYNGKNNPYLSSFRYYGMSVRPIFGEDEIDYAVEHGWCPDENHPHVIDMGAAGKWACCNVGASNPLEFGGHYAWGETEEKDYYSLDTYTLCDGSSETMRYLGFDISGTEYDVAHVKWGGRWQMPDDGQLQSLLDNCTMKYTTFKGVEGLLFEAVGGNTLFLPFAGERIEGNLLKSSGYYWSSMLYDGIYMSTAKSIKLSYSNVGTLIDRVRHCGLPVRPVIEEDDDKPNPDPAVAQGYCPDAFHPHVIDMGAAGKWACCNVGAYAPWRSGEFYAWGETEKKDYYDYNTYTHCDGSSETMHNIGSDIAGTDYDVAHVKWGGQWQMPTRNQIQLLLDNCTRDYVSLKGVKGIQFRTSGGGMLFLSFAGECREGYTYPGYGHYWSSTLWNADNQQDACQLYFDEYDNCVLSHYTRNYGKQVRPVAK